MPALFTLPKQIPLSSAGALLPGARLYFFATGTSTPQNTYQDIGLATPHTNPVVADASGVFAQIYLDASLPHYRVRLSTSEDVQLWQIDDYPSNQNVAQTFKLAATAPQLVFHETDAAANLGKWLIRAEAQALRVSLLNDAEVIQSDIFNIARTSVSAANFSFLASNSGNIDVLSGGTGLFRYKSSEVAALSAGQVSATVTGFSNVSSLNVEYMIIGSPDGVASIIVTIPGFTGTSNAATFTIAHAIFAAAAGTLQPVFVTDNGSNVQGSVRAAASSSTLTFGVGAASGGFTGSGTKGIPGEYINVIYRVAT